MGARELAAGTAKVVIALLASANSNLDARREDMIPRLCVEQSWQRFRKSCSSPTYLLYLSPDRLKSTSMRLKSKRYPYCPRSIDRCFALCFLENLSRAFLASQVRAPFLIPASDVSLQSEGVLGRTGRRIAKATKYKVAKLIIFVVLCCLIEDRSRKNGVSCRLQLRFFKAV